jgi:hypothetical protein
LQIRSAEQIYYVFIYNLSPTLYYACQKHKNAYRAWRRRDNRADYFWTGLAWTDEVAWLNIRGLHAVDLASGTLVYTWP